MPMPSISSLDVLLKSMNPILDPGTYVFGSVADLRGIEPEAIIACMREAEGVSVVLSKADALRLGISYMLECAWITLNVHSDLHAVGFTAAFSKALGDAGISCNVIAGAYHDHIFVPVGQAQEAMLALRELQASALAKG